MENSTYNPLSSPCCAMVPFLVLASMVRGDARLMVVPPAYKKGPAHASPFVAGHQVMAPWAYGRFSCTIANPAPIAAPPITTLFVEANWALTPCLDATGVDEKTPPATQHTGPWGVGEPCATAIALPWTCTQPHWAFVPPVTTTPSGWPVMAVPVHAMTVVTICPAVTVSTNWTH